MIAKLGAFERAVTMYVHRSIETLTDNMKNDIVTKQLARVRDTNAKGLAEHLPRNDARLNTRSVFQNEVVEVSRSRAATHGQYSGAVGANVGAAQSPQPMATSRQDARACYNCDKVGHLARDCQAPEGAWRNPGQGKCEGYARG